MVYVKQSEKTERLFLSHRVFSSKQGSHQALLDQRVIGASREILGFLPVEKSPLSVATLASWSIHGAVFHVPQITDSEEAFRYLAW